MTNLYGTGTKFYGKDDIRPDGSCIATKWIVVAYLPIVPLGSFYVRANRGAVVSRRLPPVTERVGWQKQHVVNVYAFWAAIALVFFTLTHRPTPRIAGAMPARIGKGEALPPSQYEADYIRPLTAGNGQPFPEASGYIEGYEQLPGEGLSAITINNTENTSDLYAKLYSLGSDTSTPVRVFFVEAGTHFTVDDLDWGTYELRYQDLDTGGIAKTESLFLKKKIESGREYFSTMELTLSKVVNGNLETEPIPAEEF